MSTAIADDFDDSKPDPYLQITDSQGQLVGRTTSTDNTLTAIWNTDIFLPVGKSNTVSVWDLDLWGSNFLGRHTLDQSTALPTNLSADAARGIYWTGRFKWRMVHF